MRALLVDEAIGKAMSGGVERIVGLDEAALGEDLAAGVLDGEGDPRLVEVALLGNVGMADPLVLDARRRR